MEEDTRNIVHRTVSPQFPSKEAPLDFTQFSHSPSAVPLYFPESHRWSDISSYFFFFFLNLFHFKGDFSFEKSQKLQDTKSGL